MKTSKVIELLLSLFILTPIWYYLLFKILHAVNASELMMFLFWIYVPAGILIKIISSVGDD